jgi:tryptophan synthase alpha chain
VDGVLVLDLPIEEAGGFRDVMAKRDIDMIFLLSPTTTDARLSEAVKLGRGFLYGISRLGVTGTRDKVAEGAEALARRMRAATSLPIALGFGISSPEHVREVGRFADAAVVGSGLVGVIAEAGKSPDLIDRIESYVRWLKNGTQLKLSPTIKA